MLVTLRAFGTEPIEQRAFDYFIARLDTIHFPCFDYHSFDTLKNKIYLRKKTSCKSRIFSNNLRLRPLNTFIMADSLITSNEFGLSYIQSDENPVEIKSKEYSFVEAVETLPKIDSIQENDLTINLTSKFILKQYYMVCISIECKHAWVLDDIYIKIDLNGNPITYVQSSKVR
ncbi:MAG TPA: hypothetical protein VE933_12840 [Chitinophagaceae bacterium]|nr:hypothetical protein [Chitinophagaceae bacterium]